MSDALTLERTAEVPTWLRVTGMDCGSCAAKVENAVRRLPGVERIEVSVTAETLPVNHGSSTDPRAIAATVRELGHGAEDPDEIPDAATDPVEPVW